MRNEGIKDDVQPEPQAALFIGSNYDHDDDANKSDVDVTLDPLLNGHRIDIIKDQDEEIGEEDNDGRFSSLEMERRMTHDDDDDENLWSQFRRSVSIILFQSHWNAMLLFGPLAMILHTTGYADSFIFVLAGLALIPLAERLSYVTECIAEQTNETFGALINATFGNAPELLISISALNSGYYKMIQLTLLGSMLTNMLLVFGAACFIGGMRWKRQSIEKTMSASGNVNVGLLLLATAEFLIPSVLELEESEPAAASQSSQQKASNDSVLNAYEEIHFDRVRYSRIVATVALISYIGYIVLTLCTHHDEFDEEDYDDDELSVLPKRVPEPSPIYVWYCERFSANDGYDNISSSNSIQLSNNRTIDANFSLNMGEGIQIHAINDQDMINDLQPQSFADSISTLRPMFRKIENDPMLSTPATKPTTYVLKEKSSDDKGSMMNYWSSKGGIVNDVAHRTRSPEYLNRGHNKTIPVKIAVVWLLLTTLFVNIISDVLVDTIDSFSSTYEINSVFVAAIVLPMLSNIAEFASAIIFSYRNKMDLCLGVTVGSAIQIALFVFPCSIVYGWIKGRPMRIFTQSFETACLLISVLMTIGILQGKSTNWFVGICLIMTYIIIASGFAFHHIDDLAGS